MATLNAKVFKHHYKKSDGTYNVKIVLYHGTSVYLDTEHYVVDKQLTKSFKIKDQFVLAQLATTLSKYRKAIGELGEKINALSADSLKQHLIGNEQKVDFLIFSEEYITELKSREATAKSAANFQTVRNHLLDFNDHHDSLPIEFISVEFISRFEKFLRKERTMIRKDQFGKLRKSKGKPLPDASIHVYLRDFQGLFSAAMKKYNRPSIHLIPIKFNPFEEYKIVDAPETEKRSLEIEQLCKIRDCKVPEGSRAELARNLGMLSFYLCGMNAVDIYKQQYAIRNGRIEYQRSKTSGRRKDKAFISIHIPEEAKTLLEFAATVRKRYATIGNLNKALSKGMRMLSKLTCIDGLEFYAFRHSFGNHASNTCRKPTKEVALALNHIEEGFKTTNIYIAKNWTIVDEVQEAVLSLLKPRKPTPVRSIQQALIFLMDYVQLPCIA
jgi:hypothetical protein